MQFLIKRFFIEPHVFIHTMGVQDAFRTLYRYPTRSILIKTCKDLKILVPTDSKHNEEARLRKQSFDKPIGKYID